MVNISNYDLSETEISALSKTLKFCPTPPKTELSLIMDDVDEFIRKVKLRVYFMDDEEGDPSTDHEINKALRRKFKIKSKWVPPVHDEAIRSFRSAVKTDILDHKQKKRYKNNLTLAERKALQGLKANKDIIIKNADKGGAVVVMNTKDYIKEAERQLNDENFYVKIPRDLTTDHEEQVRTYVNNLETQGHISDKLSETLTKFQARTARFYLLPKIHKKGIPGRPIISGNNCPTERISSFVDEILKPYVPQIKSYVKDSAEFVKIIDKLEAFSGNCILVTMDVTSLYTNIPNADGLRAIANLLRGKQHIIPNYDILKLLEMVLHKNNFEFNGENYLQVGGTAMGTKVAPTYACLFMADLEERMLASAPTLPARFKFFRYIDDLCIFWTGSPVELQEFFDHCNSFHPSIKFTYEYSRDQIVFLDTIVKMDHSTGKLYTDLYSKPTDAHNYLPATSHHPPHCIKSLPYSQTLRLKRICTKDTDFIKHTDDMRDYFARQGYSNKMFDESLEKVKKLDRQKLLHEERTASKTDAPPIPLITTYGTGMPNITKIMQTHWHTLLSSPILKELLPTKPTVAYRRPKNIKDDLVRAKLTYPPTPPTADTQRPKRCTKYNCPTCKALRSKTTFECPHTGQTIQVNRQTDCQTTNVVYLLYCREHKTMYVGETKRAFKTRVDEHFADIKHQRDKPVSNHYMQKSHARRTPETYILEHITGDPELSQNRRRQKERNWIYTLKSFTPYGLNTMGK